MFAHWTTTSVGFHSILPYVYHLFLVKTESKVEKLVLNSFVLVLVNLFRNNNIPAFSGWCKVDSLVGIIARMRVELCPVY